MNPKDIQRFMVKVKKTDNCWEWTGHIMANRYGQFWCNGKMQLTHRISYELFKGDIPQGLHIDHLCRNRKCCNPDHLETVTNKENILRGIAPSAINARKVMSIRQIILIDILVGNVVVKFVGKDININMTNRKNWRGNYNECI